MLKTLDSFAIKSVGQLEKFNALWYNDNALNKAALIQRSKINEIKAITTE